jgi:RHS repeat-associated protein
VTVYLDLNHTGQLAPNDPETQTDTLGHYFFSNLAPGTYTVAEVTQAGIQQTAPPNGTYTAIVKSGQITSGLDFGNQVVSNAPPRPPKITSTAPATAAAGQTYRYDVSVSNPDGDVLSFDLPVKPDGMVVDALTGSIDWEPTESELGPQNVVLRLKDDKNDVVLQSFTVQVDEVAPPVITSTPPQQPAQSGLPYQYQVEAQDAQNDPLTYSLLQPPAGMTIGATSGLLSWVGPQVGPGLPSAFSVTIQVDNGRGGTDTQTYTALVISPGFDRPPVITSHPDTKHTFEKDLFYQVVATDPDGDPLTYSLPVAPAGMTISSTGLVHWLPMQSDVGVHQVTIQVDDGRGLHATQNFSINVTWQVTNPGLAITSVPPATARAGHDYEYDAMASEDLDGLVVGVSAIWSLDKAPAGMSVNPRTGTVRWTPTPGQLGSAIVVLRATSMDTGAVSTQEFTIAVFSGDIPPNIVSTPSTQGTVGQLYSYAVKAEDSQGNPLTYSLVTAPAGMVINSSTGLVQWAPTAGQLGSQAVVINVSDGQGGGAVQGYSIVVSSTAGSQPPTITSMPAFLASVSQPYTYQVAATDPQGQTLSYSLINAPSGMTIDASGGLVQWTPATGQLGPNPVLLAVTNTDGEIATQNFSVTVQSPNEPPAIKSSPVTTVTAGAPYEYDVMAVDPDNDPLTYTLTTAPTGMTIDSLGRITWSPQIADIGSQPVAVSVSDGRGSTDSQQFTIAVTADTEAPKVILSLNANPVDLNTPDMAVISATDNVGVTALTLTLNGTPVPIDSMGRATLPDATAGNFTLVATASDAAGNVGTDSQTLTVIDPHVTNAPMVALTTPADGDTVTAPTQVIGTVQDPNLVSYTLSVAPIGSDSFTTFFTGTSQVTNGALGTFDPTMLQNDSYDLRLTATNTGGLSSTADVTVNVAQGLKLGNFTLSFTDLTVPVSGIPITVTRTYDTLNANQSEDFGFGWRLEFRNVDLRTSVAKTGEELNGFFNPFNTRSKVYLTLPGGQREGFTFQPKVADGLLGSFVGVFKPQFVPDAGVTDSLTVTSADLRVDTDGNFYDFDAGIPYNPADPNFGGSYLLTTKDGLAYSIDGITGQLTEVSDSNNNTLTFSDTGVASSTGTGVTFQRDPQGRIAAVVDPMGKKINYQYDANGNLVASTDRTNNATQYVYLSTPAHYLDKVIDPLGRTGARTNYDANGRLTQVVDADGKGVQLSFDETNSVATIKDRLGNPTTYVYDDRGNIVTQIDALGGVTRYTYDADNNLLTQTDPLGRTQTFTYDSRGDVLTKTDPLGNTTISTYQAFTFFATALAASRGEAAAPFTRLTSSTDPLGNTTTLSVDFFGSYQSGTDPLGHTVSVPIDQSGNVVATIDAAGNMSQYQYDGAGHEVLAIDRMGTATGYTYDVNGDQLTSSSTLTAADGTTHAVAATSSYDAEGRLMSFTDTNGGVTHTEYDAAGNQTATIDALGQRTQYVYDQTNRLSETMAPDGSTTHRQYDADGRQTATINELGRMTQYQYDALGRLVKTIYPDGSSTQTEYDADNEVTAQIDQLGNRTTYAYDADGNRIATTDPLGNITTSAYDAAGRLIGQTDPLHNTTKFVYDSNGQRTETDYADGTKTQTTYDARGLVIARTDQLGQATRSEYDANGRVVMDTDALGNQSSYTYDEMGNQLTATTTQTAADGTVRTLTARVDYDNLGRPVAVTDPVGGVTRTEYDVAGNKTATVDPLGRRTEYVYNARNELIETIYPDATHVDNKYDAVGELTATIDEAGRKTEYQYDALGRQVKTIYADGTSTQTEYDAAGRVTAQVDERGNRTEYEYDADGRRTEVKDALGNTSSSTYDADGRAISETDALGHATGFAYDIIGRLTETDYADGSKTTNNYDALGRTIARTDQLGRTTHYELDGLGRITATVDPLGERTEFTYDERGDLISRKDADGHVTVYEYDGLGRQTAVVLPALPGQQPFRSTTQYDADGNVISATDYNGSTITYTYDERNRLLVKTYPDSTSVQYSYTLTGQVTTVTDTRGTTDYSYDARDRLLSRTDPDGTQISYLYDASGDRTAVTTPAGTTSYTFDPLGRQLTVTDPQGGITKYTYDVAGNLTNSDLPNGVVETRGYDSLNRLTSLQDVGPSGNIASYTYVLGPTGLIDEVTENTGRTVAYTYDALDRLTQEKITDAVVGDRSIDYSYDAVGNRLTMNDSVAGVTSYTYDAMDRLTTSTLAGQVTNYTYDKNGNLLSRVSPAGAASYQYDFDNRLIAADTNGDGTIDERNQYDFAGNLVSQTAGGQETRFLIDTVQRYAQVVLEYAPNGAIQAAYVYGNGLISQLRGGVLSVYLIDGQHNTRELTNAAATVTDKYIYDAFGRTLFRIGSTLNLYLFAGQQTDATTGLDYMRARYYDPSLGRFISADPLRQAAIGQAGNFQFYSYTDNNPVNQTDPSGKLSFGEVVTALIVIDILAQTAVSTVRGVLAGGAAGGVQAFFEGFLSASLNVVKVPVKLWYLAGTQGKRNLFGIGDIPVVGTFYDIGRGFYDGVNAAADSNAPWYVRWAGGLHALVNALATAHVAAEGGAALFSGEGSTNVPPSSPERPFYETVAKGFGKEEEKVGAGDPGQAPVKETDPVTGNSVGVVNTGTAPEINLDNFASSETGAILSDEALAQIDAVNADELVVRQALPPEFLDEGAPKVSANANGFQASPIPVREAYLQALARELLPKFKKVTVINDVNGKEMTEVLERDLDYRPGDYDQPQPTPPDERKTNPMGQSVFSGGQLSPGQVRQPLGP